MEKQLSALEIAQARYDSAVHAWKTAKSEKLANKRWQDVAATAQALRDAQQEFAKQETKEENA